MSEDLKLMEDLLPRIRHFDWEKTKTFYYVAKFGSFANAARYLNIAQSALSRQIISLEHQLGCPLFMRHSYGVTLTRKGEELFRVVEQTFFGFKEFTHELYTKSLKGKKRKIRIATTHAIIAYILDELVYEYHKQNPDLVFELTGEDHHIDLVLNDVDIAIRPFDSQAKGVQQEVLFSLEKKLFASNEYLENYGEPKTVEDLRNHHLISHAHPKEHPYSDINWILRLGLPDGSEHEPVLTSNSLESLVKAAKKGMGIIGGYNEMEIIRNSELMNILPEVKSEKIDEYILIPNYLRKDKQIQDLKEFLKSELIKNLNV